MAKAQQNSETSEQKNEETKYSKYCKLIASCVESSSLGKLLPPEICLIVGQFSFPITFKGVYVTDSKQFLRMYEDGLAMTQSIGSKSDMIECIKAVLRWFHKGKVENRKGFKISQNQWYLPYLDNNEILSFKDMFPNCDECQKVKDDGKTQFIRIIDSNDNGAVHRWGCIVESPNIDKQTRDDDEYWIKINSHSTLNGYHSPQGQPTLYKHYNINIDKKDEWPGGKNPANCKK